MAPHLHVGWGACGRVGKDWRSVRVLTCTQPLMMHVPGSRGATAAVVGLDEL